MPGAEQLAGITAGRFNARRVEAMLKSFSQEDRDRMVENGQISVTCEFCNSKYDFAPADVGAKA
jgi:redox-regulated HSP33 family molecular chaperone